MNSEVYLYGLWCKLLIALAKERIKVLVWSSGGVVAGMVLLVLFGFQLGL